MKILAILVLTIFQTGLLFATTAIWTGSSSANWNIGGNWNPSTVPGLASGGGDIANLTGTAPAQTAISLNGTVIYLSQLNMDLGSGYTINPGGGNFNFITGSSAPAVINVTAVNGNGAQTITVPITLQSALSISQNSTASLTLSGTISGSPGTPAITISGPQTVDFSSANTNSYEGGTTISGGTLVISADHNLGNASGGISIGNGALVMNGTFTTSRSFTLSASSTISTNGSVSISSVIQGAGSLTKSGTNSLTLTASNNYTGGTTVASGILSISNDNQLGNTSGSLNFVNGTLLTTAGISTARSGSFSGSATIDTNGHADIFSGSFNGSGGITIQGTGTVTFSGTNTYAGATTIADGTTLIGSSLSLPGNITLNTTTSQVTFNQSTDGTYSGVLASAVTHAGTIIKSGTASLTVTGSSPTYSGTVSVTAGSLMLNGNLSSAIFTISPGATLRGTGTVGSLTNHGGTIDPGANASSVGTLTITGTLQLNGGSTLNMNVLPLTGDLLSVTGTIPAVLGGTLTITPLSGFYAPTTCYSLISASSVGSLGGAFSTVNSSSPNFTITRSEIVGLNYEVCIHSALPFYDFPYSTPNNQAVGNNVNSLSVAGTLSADLLNIINTFAGQSFPSINNALSQMNPSLYSAFTELQVEVDSQIISLFHRMPYLKCACFNANRLWIEPFGSTLTLKKHGEQIGSQSNTGGIAFGFDREIFDQFVLGVGGAWDYSFLSWHDSRGHGDVNGYYGCLYADYRVSDFYLGAAFLGGANLYDTSRHIHFFTTNRHAKAHFSALDIAAQINSAYFFGSPVAYFYPYANFDFLYHQTGSYTEKGAEGLSLSVRGRSDSTFRTEMGLALQLEDTNYNETMCISPLFAVGWVNMYPIQREKFNSYFVGSGPIPFNTYGWDQTWNLISADFGLGFTFHCFTLNLKYRAEVSPDSETLLFNQYGNLRLDWKW